MNEWQEGRWLRRHAIAAPFGIFAVTVLLTVRSGQWGGWGSLGLAADMVDLGAVLYAMAAVLVERGANMVFWALEQRKKRIEERKQRIEEQKTKNQAEMLAELLNKGIIQNNDQLEQWARERGIPFDNPPPR